MLKPQRLRQQWRQKKPMQWQIPRQQWLNNQLSRNKRRNKNDDGNNTSGTDSITTLVNKNHSISASYVPGDLVTAALPSTRDTQLRSVAAEGLTGLFAAAEGAGLELFCCSGYRSYDTQSEIVRLECGHLWGWWCRAGQRRPRDERTSIAVCAMDVTSASVGFDLLESFGSTAEGQFIKANAHKYGFIVRYPEGKTDITGYAYEPWHPPWYLGVDGRQRRFTIAVKPWKNTTGQIKRLFKISERERISTLISFLIEI